MDAHARLQATHGYEQGPIGRHAQTLSSRALVGRGEGNRVDAARKKTCLSRRAWMVADEQAATVLAQDEDLVSPSHGCLLVERERRGEHHRGDALSAESEA